MALAQVLDLVRPEPRVATVLTNLKISGFRTFRELTIPRLAQVNLFVGTNNAGKTSILEAVELVAEGVPSALTNSSWRRGEQIVVSRKMGSSESEADLSHLFYGHSLQPGSRFSIRGEGATPVGVECGVVEFPDDLALRFESHLLPEPRLIGIVTEEGGESFFRELASATLARNSSIRFVDVGTADFTRYLRKLWDGVALTAEEERVTSALRIIEPRIERIAFASRDFFLKLSSSDRRLPLGSLGDGIKRLLALALHLVSARGGVLLVDEIDTGLHHTVIADMWRLVIETARSLDVQVFATTHSLDCVHALAWVHQQDPAASSEVLLHRVEKDAPETVAYTLDELAVAARNHLEVR